MVGCRVAIHLEDGCFSEVASKCRVQVSVTGMETMSALCTAKPKGSICLLVKEADTTVWLFKAALISAIVCQMVQAIAIKVVTLVTRNAFCSHQRAQSANRKHVYNICTTSAQRLRRWSDIVQMSYKCFVFAGRRRPLLLD